MAATMTGYLPGDILFYVGTGVGFDITTVFNAAIQEWTDSPFVHVATAVSAIQKIDAVGQGVLLDQLNGASINAAFHYSQSVNPFDAQRLATALKWLYSQVGQVYGLPDVVNAFLDRVEHFGVIDTGHYDCSALAAEFLISAGGIPLLDGVNPHTVTPAGLANILKVKPGVK